MSTHFPLVLSITDQYAKLTFELRVKDCFEIHYCPFISTYFKLKILVSFIFFFSIIRFYPANYKYNRIKPRKNVPWITSHIRRLFHKRKRLWKRAKASNNQNDWNNYRRIRNQTKSELNKSYWLHVSSLIESKNPKRFWSFIKSKTKYQSVPPTVQLNDEVASTAADKAQLFNNFFLSIFNESDTAPPSTEAHTPLEDVIGDLICQESDVTKILLSLNTN